MPILVKMPKGFATEFHNEINNIAVIHKLCDLGVFVLISTMIHLSTQIV
jgi:hypothetical protein